MQKCHAVIANIGSDHVDIPMGKIDQVNDTVNHGVSQCNQCVNASKRYAVNYLLYESIQALSLLSIANQDSNESMVGGLYGIQIKILQNSAFLLINAYKWEAITVPTYIQIALLCYASVPMYNCYNY